MSSLLEKSVCGFKEPLVFWLWSGMAGRPNASRVKGLVNAEEVAVQTSDGRMLRGYKLNARGSGQRSRKTRAYLLVAQGNAMLADQILSSFSEFSDAGMDVYIFDYRGYGRSEGKRRLKAIVSDYAEIISWLDSRSYDTGLFYGLSFGGIVILNALGGKSRDSQVVIDSTPSRLSDHGCPEAYDPVTHLPANAFNHLFIAGGRDGVVTASMSEDLMEMARSRGASLLRDPEMAHPFMDGALIHRRRMDAVRLFLLQGATAGTE